MDPSRMELTVRITEDRLLVDAHLTFPQNKTDTTLIFYLNDKLQISGVQTNGTEALVTAEHGILLTPGLPLQRITARGLTPIRNITVHYHCTHDDILFYNNAITEDLIALNGYSAWFPQELSLPVETDCVVIENAEDFYLVKGEYDPMTKRWFYGEKGYDTGNLMLYRRDKLHIIEYPGVNFYFLDERLRPSIELANRLYQEILAFYNGGLFPRQELPVLDVVCAFPAISWGGGFRRKDLMWCITPGSSETEIAWLLAHETAHIWCIGADFLTWEDWLNETTAEWASVLFALHTNREDLVSFILDPKLERDPHLPAIRPPDGSRPKEGVHDKGTVLFYRLYQTHGVKTVTAAVRLYAETKIKTTDAFLRALREHDLAYAADFIESRLTGQ